MDNSEERKLHIAIIMDGNGRWAAARGFPRIEGHRVGMATVRKIVTLASEMGIRVLTLYAFSTENWVRPRTEVQFLMRLLRYYAFRERKLFREKKIRVRVIGDLAGLPKGARDALAPVIEETSQNDGLVLQLALNYSGRSEIVRAFQRISQQVREGSVEPNEISQDLISRSLDTHPYGDPDLVIRTSGELRLSNFLLWQAAYAEFYFSPKFWPDFSEDDFVAALEDFRMRQRRFGATSDQAEGGISR